MRTRWCDPPLRQSYMRGVLTRKLTQTSVFCPGLNKAWRLVIPAYTNITSVTGNSRYF